MYDILLISHLMLSPRLVLAQKPVPVPSKLPTSNTNQKVPPPPGVLVASEQKTGLIRITLILQKFFGAETLTLSLSDYLAIRLRELLQLSIKSLRNVGVTIILPKLKPCGLPLQRLKYQCFVNHSLPKFGDGHDHIAETTK